MHAVCADTQSIRPTPTCAWHLDMPHLLPRRCTTPSLSHPQLLPRSAAARYQHRHWMPITHTQRSRPRRRGGGHHSSVTCCMHSTSARHSPDLTHSATRSACLPQLIDLLMTLHLFQRRRPRWLWRAGSRCPLLPGAPSRRRADTTRGKLPRTWRIWSEPGNNVVLLDQNFPCLRHSGSHLIHVWLAACWPPLARRAARSMRWSQAGGLEAAAGGPACGGPASLDTSHSAVTLQHRLLDVTGGQTGWCGEGRGACGLRWGTAGRRRLQALGGDGRVVGERRRRTWAEDGL